MLLSLSPGLPQFTRSWLTLPDLNGEKGCSHPLSAFHPGGLCLLLSSVPAPRAVGCSHPGSTICTHCFGAQEREWCPLPFRTQANVPVPLCHQFLYYERPWCGRDGQDVAPGAVCPPVRLGSVCRHSYSLGRQKHRAQACNECTVRR